MYYKVDLYVKVRKTQWEITCLIKKVTLWVVNGYLILYYHIMHVDHARRSSIVRQTVTFEFSGFEFLWKLPVGFTSSSLLKLLATSANRTAGVDTGHNLLYTHNQQAQCSSLTAFVGLFLLRL
jgi:hypothetical protein